MSLWNTFLYYPLINLLIFCYQVMGNNLGLAIILITVLIRLALLPLVLPGLKSAQKIQKIKPELDKLKKKHNKDKQKLAQEQIKLYQKYNINPASGILPMIIQLLVIIALYRAFNHVIANNNAVGELNNILYPFIKLPSNHLINSNFLYLNLTQPDTINLKKPLNLLITKINQLPGVFLILAAFFQYYSSKLLSVPQSKKQKKAKNNQEDMAQSMQKQMRLMMPIMTILIGIRFPSGLVLYWLTYSVFMIFQQMYIKKQS